MCDCNVETQSPDYIFLCCLFFVIKSMKILDSFNEIVFQRKENSLVNLVLLGLDWFPKIKIRLNFMMLLLLLLNLPINLIDLYPLVIVNPLLLIYFIWCITGLIFSDFVTVCLMHTLI